MTRHLLMDPAFPDLVAADAAEETERRSRCPRPSKPAEREPIAEDILRLLARLW